MKLNWLKSSKNKETPHQSESTLESTSTHSSSPADDKPKLNSGQSIDSILQQTRSSSERYVSRTQTELQDRKSALEVAENELLEKEFAIRLKEVQLIEFERGLSEADLLLEMREKAVTQRENLLKSKESYSQNPSSSESLSKLQTDYESLNETYQNSLDELKQKSLQIDKLSQRISHLEAEIKSLQNSALNNTPAINSEDLLEREKRLTQKETLLAEREAFIEESENTLFNKAQELQELETFLNQKEDDLA